MQCAHMRVVTVPHQRLRMTFVRPRQRNGARRPSASGDPLLTALLRDPRLTCGRLFSLALTERGHVPGEVTVKYLPRIAHRGRPPIFRSPSLRRYRTYVSRGFVFVASSYSSHPT